MDLEDEFDLMPSRYRRPSVVDMASEILEMHDRIQQLEREVAYYKPYQALYMESLNESIANSQSMVGTMLGALLDPDSVLSIGLKTKALAATPVLDGRE